MVILGGRVYKFCCPEQWRRGSEIYRVNLSLLIFPSSCSVKQTKLSWRSSATNIAQRLRTSFGPCKTAISHLTLLREKLTALSGAGLICNEEIWCREQDMLEWEHFLLFCKPSDPQSSRGNSDDTLKSSASDNQLTSTNFLRAGGSNGDHCKAGQTFGRENPLDFLTRNIRIHFY